MAGAIRQIKKKMNQPVILADTGVTFNGFRVALVVDSAEKAVLAKKFAAYFQFLAYRSSFVNMLDLLSGQLEISKRINEGRSILN